MALDWLKNKYNEVSRSLKDEVTKIRNQAFLEGVVAGCVLVAYADGIVKPEEKQKMLGFMRHNDIMAVFKTEDIIKLFEKYSSRYEFDRDIGEMDALGAIAKLKEKPDQGRLLVRVCCAIAGSDGDFDESEKRAVRKIANELGLNPADFDV